LSAFGVLDAARWLAQHRVVTSSFAIVELCGMPIASLDTPQLLAHMFESLARGDGGWLVTANLDFLRRHVKDPSARAIYAGADLRVADGMPLVWASKLKGTPLPERVAGSSLVMPICERGAREKRSVYLLGGDAEASAQAAHKLLEACPGLVIAGRSSPWISKEPTEAELAPIRAELLATRPDFVLVAFGSPKQEHLIAALRNDLPGAWWIGVGISLSFLSGHVKRAPALVQKLGLEWVHRLVQEPKRLFRRYVIEDLPFAFELFGRAAVDRVTKPSSTRS
jgi:N-acetylglucosaminyldiphosphoundecaprenol N-acetyl-beta-D-mannosaminyltransferase